MSLTSNGLSALIEVFESNFRDRGELGASVAEVTLEHLNQGAQTIGSQRHASNCTKEVCQSTPK